MSPLAPEHQLTAPQMTTSHAQLARTLGIPEEYVTDYVLAELARGPSIAYRIRACRDDPDALAVVVRLDRAAAGHGLLASVGNAVTRARAGRQVMLGDEAYQARLAVCKECEHLRQIVGAHTCGLCGCVVEWKARLAGEACPDTAAGPAGRWG